MNNKYYTDSRQYERKLQNAFGCVVTSKGIGKNLDELLCVGL
jgi:hypothetical protein